MYNFRFAPSPTGMITIGNARTAVFCYLLAKHYNGKFFLRIEDTDKQRSEAQYVDNIVNSLQFLGINWDNKDIVYQSQRTEYYQSIVDILLFSGFAYKCYLTAEEAQELKQEGVAFRSPYRNNTDTTLNDIDESDMLNEQENYNNNDMNDDILDDNEDYCNEVTQSCESTVRSNNTSQHKPYTVRFKVPEGETTFQDGVCGSVTVKHEDIEDFVLLRSDGSPTFTLCVVADDHNMDVTYVLRGSDHLINTVKQLMIFKAMSWNLPKYTHIPLILDSTGKKLSKRNGDIGVLDYARKGVLPEAIVNCLMRLGWGHKDDEFVPFERAVEIFSEEGFSKSAARFDEAKLMDLSGKYMRFLSSETILKYAKNHAKTYHFYPVFEQKTATIDNKDDNSSNEAIDNKDDNLANEIAYHNDNCSLNKTAQKNSTSADLQHKSDISYCHTHCNVDDLCVDNNSCQNYDSNIQYTSPCCCSESHCKQDKTCNTFSDAGWNRFTQALPELVKRANTLEQLLEMGRPLLLDDLRIEGEFAFSEQVREFINSDYWRETPDELLESFKQYCSDKDLKFSQVAKELRFRLTQAKVSPSLFVIMHVLGKELCLKRL